MKDILKQLVINHMSYINFFVIGRAIMEIILFVITLRIVKKAFCLFFDNILHKVSDTEMRKNYQTLKQLGIYCVYTILGLFFIINIFENFGIDMKPVLATAGVLGVAVGFGAKKFVEDVITGLSIIFTGQIRVGDYVTVNNSTGTVEKVTLSTIVIRAYNGDVHYLRNGQIDTVINRTKHYSFPMFRVNVAYKTDVTHTMEVLKKLGKELRENQLYSRFVLSDIEVLGLESFHDSSIEILCRIKTTPQEQWIIKRKFNQMIKERFEKEGIEIPFPQLVVGKSDN